MSFWVQMQGEPFDPKFPIKVKNIQMSKHTSDSGVYDKDGGYVYTLFLIKFVPNYILSQRLYLTSYMIMNSEGLLNQSSKRSLRSMLTLIQMPWQKMSWLNSSNRTGCLRTTKDGMYYVVCTTQFFCYGKLLSRPGPVPTKWIKIYCRLAAFVEWRILFMLGKDEKGLLQKETVRAVFDGSLFDQLAAKQKAKKAWNWINWLEYTTFSS